MMMKTTTKCKQCTNQIRGDRICFVRTHKGEEGIFVCGVSKEKEIGAMKHKIKTKFIDTTASCTRTKYN